MNVIVCVASASGERLSGFLSGLMGVTRGITGNITLLVIGNYKGFKSTRVLPPLEPFQIVCREGSPERRPYAAIMADKVNFVSEHADEESIVWFVDDDYAVNPFALVVMKTIFEGNPHVDHLSLLRGPNVPDGDINLSGWQFLRWDSQMGGTMMMRWSAFKNHARAFFEQVGVDNMFDQAFWVFLKREYNVTFPVFMLTNPFSLIQHCRFGSLYGHDKGQHGHMFAINYCPRGNPFEMRVYE